MIAGGNQENVTRYILREVWGGTGRKRRKDGDEGKTSAKNKVKSESHVRDIRGSKRRGRGKKTFIARPDGLGDNA